MKAFGIWNLRKTQQYIDDGSNRLHSLTAANVLHSEENEQQLNYYDSVIKI